MNLELKTCSDLVKYQTIKLKGNRKQKKNSLAKGTPNKNFLSQNQNQIEAPQSADSGSNRTGEVQAMAAKQMEEIQRKLAMLNYPRANAPAQSLLFAGMERYTLLEWLFFRSVSQASMSYPLPSGN